MPVSTSDTFKNDFINSLYPVPVIGSFPVSFPGEDPASFAHYGNSHSTIYDINSGSYASQSCYNKDQGQSFDYSLGYSRNKRFKENNSEFLLLDECKADRSVGDHHVNSNPNPDSSTAMAASVAINVTSSSSVLSSASTSPLLEDTHSSPKLLSPLAPGSAKINSPAGKPLLSVRNGILKTHLAKIILHFPFCEAILIITLD